MIVKLILKLIIFILITFKAFAVDIKKIEIVGNNRVSNETIILFGDINVNKEYTNRDLNKIIQKLFKTEFFKDINLKVEGSTLYIDVIENPVIQNIKISGIKNKRILKVLEDNLSLKIKGSFLENKVRRDENILKNILNTNGYYFSKINTKVKRNDNNTIDLNFDIELGDRAYIEKIKFIGDKKIKDRVLKNVIITEESKFWKFISSKKFLDNNRITLDEKLLKNYYLNNGFYKVKINTTSAQIIDSKNFELIFNIDAGNKYKFNNLNLNLPNSFDVNNFKDIQKTLNKLKNKTYSLNKIEKILDEIDRISLNKQYEFTKATYVEKSYNDTIDLEIKIVETEKKYVEKINIFGNYITNENVIRNSIITDEGDPFNEILFNKSINNIKSKNIFKSVKSKVKDGSSEQFKVIDITVDEKPTGEIAAGAGTGTTGSSVSFSISENNYLGEGTKLNLNTTVSDESIIGKFSLTYPNFKNTDKLLRTSVENSKNDLMSKYGYETKKTGFSFGTSFEQYQDIFFSPEITTFFESLETDSTASSLRKKQEGDYFDTNFTYSLALNKLNQNFQPSDGYRSSFSQTLPLIADDKSIYNSFEFSKYNKLGNETIISVSTLLQAVKASEGDVRVSKRIFIPSRKLRGFVSGRVGPKDKADYIGGNYGASFNVAATLPKLFVDLQNVDFSLFLDSANLWGVDYDSELDKSKLRSSTGLAIDWFTPIGPMSFSFAKPITKANTDETETFRFKIGTTF